MHSGLRALTERQLSHHTSRAETINYRNQRFREPGRTHRGNKLKDCCTANNRPSNVDQMEECPEAQQMQRYERIEGEKEGGRERDVHEPPISQHGALSSSFPANTHQQRVERCVTSAPVLSSMAGHPARPSFRCRKQKYKQPHLNARSLAQ